MKSSVFLAITIISMYFATVYSKNLWWNPTNYPIHNLNSSFTVYYTTEHISFEMNRYLVVILFLFQLLDSQKTQIYASPIVPPHYIGKALPNGFGEFKYLQQKGLSNIVQKSIV